MTTTASVLQPHRPGCTCPNCNIDLDALTELARAAGESLHPDDVIEGATRRTVQRMQVNASGTGLELVDMDACDWCDQPAALRVTDPGTSHTDLACDFHFGYWFAKPLAAGEQFTVERIR